MLASLDHDVFRIIERFERLLPIGFYYKTLYKPRLLWKIAEPIIRRLAGLGRVPTEVPAGEYDHRYEYVDVLAIRWRASRDRSRKAGGGFRRDRDAG